MKFEVPEQYKNSMGIYSITNTNNSKRIIGQTLNFYKRFHVYKRQLTHGTYGNRHLQFAYNKYGSGNFKMELVCLCDKSDLVEMETYYCRAFNSMNEKFGYNKKDPILHGKYSEDAKRRMSLAQLGNKNSLGHKFPDELKKNIADIHRGNKYAVGHKCSEESRIKMSKSHIGKKLSEECKKKIGNASCGHKLSEEAKIKIGLAAIGRNKGNTYCLGRKASEETRMRISQAQIGKVSPLRGRSLSEDHKRKLSESHMGQVAWNKGLIKPKIIN